MKCLPYIVIAILACIIIADHGKKNDAKEIRTTDTVTVVVTDTITEYKPVYKDEVQLGEVTIVVEGKKTNIPTVQRHYKGDSYDAWISGYNPVMDSIKVYNKIEYRTVTNDIVRHIDNKKTNIYLEGGFKSTGGTIIPELGISINPRGRLSYGANIGLYKNKPVYGFKVGIQLNK